MANNEKTDDLAQFHRSFTLTEDNEEECTPESRESFYKTNSDKFQVESQEFGRNQRNGIWEDQDQGYGSSRMGSDQSDEEDQDDQSWWGQQQMQKQSRRGARQQNNRQGDWQQDDEQDQNTEEPVMKTKVIEYNHKICFSTKPVKQCPEGTTSAHNYQQDNSGERQQGQKSKSVVKMAFACLDRSSVDARRMARQARRGVVVELDSENQPNFREDVQQPERCVRY
jgi:hypothetical protein